MDQSSGEFARPGAVSMPFARFGIFELEKAGPELRRKGRVVNLSQQSFLILTYLVEAAGKVVSREDLQKALWPAGTFVEFELALYTAVNRLRRDLGDSAAQPIYIETVPKRGYRFIAPIEFVGPPDVEVIAQDATPSTPVSAPAQSSFSASGGNCPGFAEN